MSKEYDAILIGAGIFCLPSVSFRPSPLEAPQITERFTEFVVIIALMGAGLKLDRPFHWRRWGVTWRLLAITMETRHPRFPNVPTFRELGYDLVSGAYRGIAVPNSTSEGLRQRLSTLMSEINQDATFIDKMEEGGFALIDVTYDQMDDFMAQKKQEYKIAANSAGLAP